MQTQTREKNESSHAGNYIYKKVQKRNQSEPKVRWKTGTGEKKKGEVSLRAAKRSKTGSKAENGGLEMP